MRETGMGQQMAQLRDRLIMMIVRDLLVEKGLIRLPDQHKYPINKEKRLFQGSFIFGRCQTENVWIGDG